MSWPSTSWTAWHLHLESASRELCDRVITEALGPTVAELPTGSWFFVRYWQGGPHVRLRVRDLDSEQVTRIGRALAERLAEAGRPLAGEEPLDPAGFTRQAERLAAAGEGGVALTAQELMLPGVHAGSYLPEYGRYGGEQLLPVSEALFATSSELSLAFLRTRPSEKARRLLALRATACAAAVLEEPFLGGSGDAAAHGAPAGYGSFTAYGAEAWRTWALRFGYPAEVLHKLDADCASAATRLAQDGRSVAADLTDVGPLSGWRDGLRDAVAQWRRSADRDAARIAFSHVHMLHNRLGLSTLEELRTYAVLAHRSTPPTAGRAAGHAMAARMR
ncbi:lantibiotic dehydratase C-terminal domain-containing protein [Kitasatospora sp. GP82]|uniref:lantibiotic dehydratase C-terminal domain-containing protein n=1 Tax=Kitasatospora sp. GP82 TaxID=3035089 RepID=UPI0024737D77|nr:lantibiotic dehydratase C-terminal domain-containing protein [Kitasatospora sp. GP82]MDH6129999.1 hypothetical protein [Kitasatospora sp. GP82]